MLPPRQEDVAPAAGARTAHVGPPDAVQHRRLTQHDGLHRALLLSDQTQLHLERADGPVHVGAQGRVVR